MSKAGTKQDVNSNSFCTIQEALTKITVHDTLSLEYSLSGTSSDSDNISLQLTKPLLEVKHMSKDKISDNSQHELEATFLADQSAFGEAESAPRPQLTKGAKKAKSRNYEEHKGMAPVQTTKPSGPT